MAHGLQSFHQDVCGKDYVGVCPQLQKSFNHTIFFVIFVELLMFFLGQKFLCLFFSFQNYLMNVSFITKERDSVEFNPDGDVRAHYDIMNFQNINGTFSYVKIGFWNNHTLNLTDEIKPPNGSEKFSSVCSKPCHAGFYKVIKNWPRATKNLTLTFNEKFTMKHVGLERILLILKQPLK